MDILRSWGRRGHDEVSREVSRPRELGTVDAEDRRVVLEVDVLGSLDSLQAADGDVLGEERLDAFFSLWRYELKSPSEQEKLISSNIDDVLPNIRLDEVLSIRGILANDFGTESHRSCQPKKFPWPLLVKQSPSHHRDRVQ